MAPCRLPQGDQFPITATATASPERLHLPTQCWAPGARDPLVVAVKNMLTPPIGDSGKTAEGKTSWKNKNVNIARAATANEEKLH